MNYYKDIKNELLNNEVCKKVKNYAINKSDLQTYYNVGKLLSKAGKHYGQGIIKEYSIRLTNELLSKLKVLANEESMTVSEYMLAKSIPDYAEKLLTVKKIIEKIDCLASEEKFSLRDLYSQEEWLAFTIGSRISAGREFYKSYERNEYHLKDKVKFLGKNSANLALYKKK